MKNYESANDRKNRVNRNDILSVKQSTDGTLDILFADGTIFTGVENSEEQLQKIEERQDLQLKVGLANLPKIKAKLKRKKIAGVILGITTVAPLITATLIECGIVDVPCSSTIVNLIAMPFGFRTGIEIAGSMELADIVKELEKLQFRNKHRDYLDKISLYPNSLANLKSKKAARINRIISNQQDPFSNTRVNNFSQNDLETIVENIKREEGYQFSYKTPNQDNNAEKGEQSSGEKGIQFVKKPNPLNK